MPSFTAVALATLLEPKGQKPIAKPPTSPQKLEVGGSSKAKNICHVSPTLYTTPKTTALPDSPTSLSPSPYVINHKRRGPHLLKSHSESDVSQSHSYSEEVRATGTSERVVGLHEDVSATLKVSTSHEESSTNGFVDDKSNSAAGLSGVNSSPEPLVVDLDKNFDIDDFFEPRESMSAASFSENEGISAAESSLKQSLNYGEYFDACEDLLSDGNVYCTRNDIDSELREMRLNLFMEIEKRKQSEEALINLQNQWQRIKQQLALVGLTLPPAPTFETEKDEVLEDNDPAENLCQQVLVTREVATAIGRGFSRAEIEAEMESQIAAKNFEITRLGDRLQYCEAVNREMSQRNQEIVEMARRNRQGKKRRQRWLYGSISFAVLLGSASLACFYLPSKASENVPQTSSCDC